MRELNFFEKIISWFKHLFINKEKAKENSDKAKREMCKRAVHGGVCDHECDECVWNTLYDDKVKIITHGNCMMCGKELTEGLFFCKECEVKIESEE